jgi:hypothetical protein
MKELPKNLVFMVLLVISISFLVSAVYAAGSTTANNNFVYTSYSKDNSYAVKSTSDNNIYFFDNSKNAVPWTYNIGRYIGSIAISPDGRYVAVGVGGGLIYFFDQQGNLIWKKQFGTSGIVSISFSKDSSYIDVENVLSQPFSINVKGEQIDRPKPQVVTIIPSSALTPISPIPIPTSPNNLPITDPLGFFGISFFWWGVIALIIFVILWVNHSSNQKKGTPITHQPPPQNGMIYVESIPYGAAIYFNGIYSGVSPVTLYNILPATHTIKATLNGYNSDSQRITIKAGQTVTYSPTLRRSSPSPPKPQPKPQPKLSFQDLITQLGAEVKERGEAQKQLINLVNSDVKTATKQIIKELEKQPSTIKREIVNLLFYLSKESPEGQKVTEELINALTYSPPEVKWLIIQTLGRLKDKRALHALESSVSDTDFLVKYWAIISLKSIQES